MKKLSKVILDAKNGKLYFGDGNCNEVREYCEAICCRKYDVTITEEEFKSGFYEVRDICVLTKDDCEPRREICESKVHILKKREDGACIYLDGNSKCSIHDKRPQACRDFECTDGWTISAGLGSLARSVDSKRPASARELAAEVLKDEMVFRLNGSARIKTIFYTREKGEVLLVKEIKNHCGLVSSRRSFENDAVTEDMLFFVIELLNGINTLIDIRRKLNDKFKSNLTREDLAEILNMFYAEALVVFNRGMKKC